MKPDDQKKVPKNEKNGLSYFGLGKILIWIVGVVCIFLLKQCGFDVDYPRTGP
jgi:hypothetical protein